MTYGTRTAAHRTLMIGAFVILLAVGPGTAPRAEEAPPGATIGRTAILFNDDILGDLGIELIDVALTAEPYRSGSLGFAIQSGGWLEYTGGEVNTYGFSAGSLLHSGGFTLAFDGLELSIDGFELRVAEAPYAFDLFDAQGKRWFRLGSMQYELSPDGSELRLINTDMLLSPEFASILGRKDLSNSYLAVIDMVIPVGLAQRRSLLGEVLSASAGGCPAANVGQPVDIALTSLESMTQLAREAGGRVAVAASAELSNFGTNTVEWFQTIVPDDDPGDIGPHPYLSLHFYRLANGRLSQIGQSDVKHAFLSINSGCPTPCPAGHMIYPGCSDVYGANLNGQQFHLGPREEVSAFSGAWTRVGSHFDSYDQNTASINPNLTDDFRDHRGSTDHDDSYEHRLVVQEPDLQTNNAQYFFEAWYVVANDSDLTNSMGHRQVAPNLIGSLWSFPFTTALTSGSILDEFVDPGDMVPGTDTDFVDTGQGRYQIAVRTSTLPNGKYHYEYAIMNFDFDRQIKSFRVPLPSGANLTNIEFIDGDASSGNNWNASVTGSFITWNAPSGNDNELDWGTLYNFAFDADPEPAIANVTVTALEAGAVLAAVSSLAPDPNFVPASGGDNDDCTDAIPLSLGTTADSLLGATNDGDSSLQFDNGTLIDVWYTYTPTRTGTLRINTCRTHDLPGIDQGIDTVVSIHSSCPGLPGNEVAANDDAQGSATDPLACDLIDTEGNFLDDGVSYLDAALKLPGILGQPVLIRVAQFGLPGGDFVITVEEPPMNDNVSGATALSTMGTTEGTLTGAAIADEAVLNDFAQPGVWYTYTPASDGTMLVDTCGTFRSTGLDTTISIRSVTNPTNSGSQLDFNDDYAFGDNPIACDGPGGSQFDSAIVYDVTSGQEVLIRVSRFDANTDGDFTIAFDPNPGFSVTITATPSDIGQGESIALGWFSATADDGCTASGGWSGSQLTSGLLTLTPAATRTYMIECFRSGFGPVTDSVTVTVDELANDNCTSPITVSASGEDSFVTDTTDATTSIDDPNTFSCSFADDPDGATAWYEFTPNSTGVVTLSTIGSDYDTVLSVWLEAEGCGSLDTKISCNDDADDESLQSELNFMAQQGTTYLVQVGAWNGEPGGRLVFNVPEPGASSAMAVALCTLVALRRRRARRR